MQKVKSVKVLTAVTVSDSAVLIRGTNSYLRDAGYTPILCSSSGPEIAALVEREKPLFYPIEMVREPHVLRDLGSLWEIMKCISTERPDIVNAGTPKAGFLFILAAWLLGTQHRVYHLRGLRHESLSGASRALQMFIERITGAMATRIICLTPSVRDLATAEGLFDSRKCVVLGPGSSGIELDRYDPRRYTKTQRLRIRHRLGIAPDAIVLGYVGRLVPRKGIGELMAAWQSLRESHPNAVLLLVGPVEPAQPLQSHTIQQMELDPRVILAGKVDDVADYYSIMDVFTLPAHWEGFGNVVVEAAAMGIPVVTTLATGTKDAAKQGYNATLVPPKDPSALACAIAAYFDDPQLRKQHGHNGIEWASGFSRTSILAHLHQFYTALLR